MRSLPKAGVKGILRVLIPLTLERGRDGHELGLNRAQGAAIRDLRRIAQRGDVQRRRTFF
jgi:hypothetical protein